MMYKEALEAIGGFDELLYPEDYDLILRCYNHQFQIKGIHETTLLWREHPKEPPEIRNTTTKKVSLR